MKHALVVGGTGMLSGVSLWLLDQGYHVSIIARNSDRMKNLIEQTDLDSHITPHHYLSIIVIMMNYKRKCIQQ